MYITVGRKDIVIGPKGRLAFSTTVVLIMHLLMFWGFAQLRPKIMDLPERDYQPPMDVEVYQIKEPPPEPVPVLKITPREIQPPQVEPKPVPQPQPQVQEAAAAPARATSVEPVPAPPSPVPSPAIKTQTIEKIELQQQQAKQLNQNIAANNTADLPTLESQTKTKQRKDEEAGLQKPVAGVTSLSSLNLHATPDSAPVLEADVAPSGLPAPGGGSPGGGGSPAAGGGGGSVAGLAGAQGIIGKDLKGRGSLTQAMQNHDYCAEAKIKGKTPPANCKTNALTGETSLGLVDRPDLQKAAGQRDANLQYKTGAGNSDYWNRVSGSPSTGIQPNFRPDDGVPHKGAYSNPKDERVMNGAKTDPKSGN